MNSLLEVHVDFNTASKLPPTITKEKTDNLEVMIKQRIQDEMFDDPVRKILPNGKKGDNDDLFDFTKSKKGLGELYEDNYRKKLLNSDSNAFLLSGNDLTGADSALKQEVSVLMKTLFFQLDQLSNFHFTPKPAFKESTISTQNVPSMMIEDAIPISVSTGQTKSAREVFSINQQKLRDKSELTKEERHKERATRKRKIKSHLKHRELNKKEHKRDLGMAMHDRFEAKHVKKGTKKPKAGEAPADDKKSKAGSKNEMKSSKFFSKLQEVVKDDQKKKDNKRKAREDNLIVSNHTNQNSKRFKL